MLPGKKKIVFQTGTDVLGFLTFLISAPKICVSDKTKNYCIESIEFYFVT